MRHDCSSLPRSLVTGNLVGGEGSFWFFYSEQGGSPWGALSGEFLFNSITLAAKVCSAYLISFTAPNKPKKLLLLCPLDRKLRLEELCGVPKVNQLIRGSKFIV